MRSPLLPAALLALAVTGASAQTTSPAAPEAPPHGQGAVGEPLQPGANSFTEAQVRERFAKMGFGEITDLKKTDQGIWQGIATHAGKQVRIGMDYRGNVAAQ
ncbi:hypothetical protein [Methylobacterium radiodurans]|uniref:PepSY domain-containing protein n=1 Tax=Methylobacterium radiodurans TaxID=2202828 RepID=A0A2U8VLZ2_9HYPH|nr:hypothetical protein [Methylobacterium radiodurans]AWN34634.1 hypothetical protein DK427_01850 [Methylobacterium radiodurans]